MTVAEHISVARFKLSNIHGIGKVMKVIQDSYHAAAYKRQCLKAGQH